jgi:hypothetical protein
MINRYNQLWPDNPFIFHIPFQDFAPKEDEKTLNISTPKSIKATVLTLLKDIPDEEWIYWCIDDKYPEQLDVPALSNIYRGIISKDDKSFDAILFSSRKFKKNSIVNQAQKIVDVNNQVYFRRKGYGNLWLHQFIRAKIIKNVFVQFPDEISIAKEMDYLKTTLTINPDFKLYSTAKNLGFFGESMSSGKLTRNCYESMLEMGIKHAPMGVNKKQYYYIGFPIRPQLKTSYLKYLLKKFYWQIRKKLK